MGGCTTMMLYNVMVVMVKEKDNVGLKFYIKY